MNNSGKSAEKSSMVTVVNTGAIANISTFNTGDDWEIFIERLDQYFLANLIEAQRKVPVLLTSVSETVYKILKNLCNPEKPSTKTYEELTELLNVQFKTKKSAFRKRVQFDSLKQTNESISDWFIKVKTSASDCEFGAQLEERVKDKFVAGMKPGRILDRLCEEEISKTLKDLFELAKNKEVLMHEERRIEVNRLQDTPRTRHTQKVSYNDTAEKRNIKVRDTGEKKCFYCAGVGHDFKKCKFKNYNCKICKKKGHIAKACKSKIINCVESETDTQVKFLEMLNININKASPIYLKVKINGKILEMEVDTGAGCSCIPLKIYEKKFGKVKLEPTYVQLKTYTGQVIKPVGEINVNLEINNTTKVVKILIVKESEKVILGRNILNEFELSINMGSNNVVNSIVKSTEVRDEQYQGKKSVVKINSNSNSSELSKLLERYDNLFTNELGTYSGEKIHLELNKNVQPVFHKPKPLPFAFREKVKLELDRLENTGVIEKVDNAQWGTPLVPVLKANGKDIRVCANYKITVNKYLKDANHPLPRIDEIFTALQGGKTFTKLDLSNAYNQLVLDEQSRDLLAWSTPYGIYKVNRLPFGTKPACSIFQRILEKTLQGINGTINLLDDIVITGKSHQEHIQNLKQVLERLDKNGFRLNKNKCEFFKESIHYLGHKVSKEGLEKDERKVESILNFPKPRNVKEVRIFTGMINYYSKFIPSLSIKLKPLYELIKKNVNFVWTKECQVAFEFAKKELTSDKVLIHFDKSKPLRLCCDASQYGLGAVLSHVLPDGSDRPICFISRVLNSAEKNYSMIHKEALSIYWSCQKLYQYLIGTKFELVSDHKPLQALFGENRSLPPMVAGRLQRWSLFLAGFNYTFKHVKGIENIQADALSRCPLANENLPEIEEKDYINFIEKKVPIDLFKIRSETRKDPVLGKLYNYIQYGFPKVLDDIELKKFNNCKNELNIDKGIIMWGYRVIIPHKYRNQLLNELHTTHEGIVKMKSNARAYFWWPGLDADIEILVNSCKICAESRPEPKKCKIISKSDVTRPFEKIHADFLGPLDGKMILIIVDKFSKWPEAFIMKQTDAKSLIEKFREYFARFGLPKIVETDNGRQFESHEFINFLQINGIKFLTSPPFHPATNGLAENSVKSFKNALMKLMKENEYCSFETLMNKYLFHYRNSVHVTTGVTPSSLLFRNKVRTRLDLLKEPNKSGQLVIRKGREDVFKIGDEVWCRDYRNPNKKNWVPCIIDEILGEKIYMCKLVKEDLIWKRHLDQILVNKGNLDNSKLNYTVSKDDKTLMEYPEDYNKDMFNDKCITPNVCLDFPKIVDNSNDSADSSKRVTEVEVEESEDAVKQNKSKDSSITLNVNERPKRNIKPPQRLNL